MKNAVDPEEIAVGKEIRCCDRKGLITSHFRNNLDEHVWVTRFDDGLNSNLHDEDIHEII